MNQEKIGKFINENRKKKNLTQEELAKKLGVTNRTISNWEKGKNLPDYNLLIPLTKELEISASELINGEYEEEKTEQKKTIEKIINFLKHIEKEKEKKYKTIGSIIFLTGLILILIVLLFFPTTYYNNESYIFLGIIISGIGLLYLTHREKILKMILINTTYIILLISFLLFQDFITVKYFKMPPRYYSHEYNRIFTGHVYYQTPLYDVYACETDMYANRIGKDYTIVSKAKQEDIQGRIKEYCNLDH